jgi:hypothetical protein
MAAWKTLQGEKNVLQLVRNGKTQCAFVWVRKRVRERKRKRKRKRERGRE